MKIVILGAGIQGGVVAMDLCDKELSPGEKDITICDYDLKKAEEAAKSLGIKAAQVDVTKKEALINCIKDAEVAINCVQYDWNVDIMKACLEVGANYIDLGGLFHVTRKQFDLHDEFKKAGLIAVLGMGSTPGTMNVMAGYAASKLDTVETADVICACGDFTKSNAVIGIPYSLITIMEEHTKDPVILKDGEFVSVPAGSGKEVMSFPEPVGSATVFYCLHSEPAQFARSFKDKGIKNSSFKLSLPDAFEERLAFLADLGFGVEDPVIVDGKEVNPLKTLLSVVNKYLDSYDSSQDGELNDCDILRAIVKGKKDGIEKEIMVESIIRTSKKWGIMAGVLDTAIPPSIVAQMICNKVITETGVCSPEQCIPALPYFKELARREMPVYYTEKTPLSCDDFELTTEVMTRAK